MIAVLTFFDALILLIFPLAQAPITLLQCGLVFDLSVNANTLKAILIFSNAKRKMPGLGGCSSTKAFNHFRSLSSTIEVRHYTRGFSHNDGLPPNMAEKKCCNTQNIVAKKTWPLHMVVALPSTLVSGINDAESGFYRMCPVSHFGLRL